MMNDYSKILNAHNFVVSDIFIKELLKKDLTLNEFLILLYFLNSNDKTLDLKVIKTSYGLNEKQILEAFTELNNKGLLTMEVIKDNDGHIVEVISLEELYKLISISLNEEQNIKNKENIFDVFEREFNRKLTPMEYEIVNAWLDNNNSEELILGALKESIYNGVKSFRYIDKIIYEWGKKGFKTMEDVKNHMNNQYKKQEEKKEELFDYDWLDDNEV